MTSLQRSVALVLVGAVVSVAAMYVGAWWMAFLAGLAIGVIGPRARFGIPLGALVGLGAWTAPLLVAHTQYGLGSTATAIAAIMGLTGAGDLPVALTVLVGTLLGASGAWLGSASTALIGRGTATSISLARRKAEPPVKPNLLPRERARTRNSG
jgi:hypothetical protein